MVFILLLGPVGNLILISEIRSHYLGRTYQSGNQRSPFLIGTCPGWLTSTMLYLMLNNLNIIESKIYFIYKFNIVDNSFHNILLLFLNVVSICSYFLFIILILLYMTFFLSSQKTILFVFSKKFKDQLLILLIFSIIGCYYYYILNYYCFLIVYFDFCP